MKLYLFLLVAFFPTVLNAQDCSKQKDQQTGEMLFIGTTTLPLTPSAPPAKFNVIKAGQNNSIGLSLISGTPAVQFDVLTMKLKVELADGNSKTFLANTRSKVTSVAGITMVIFEATVSAADLEHIHDNVISQIRLYFNGREEASKNITVSQKSAGEIISSLACLTSE